MRPASFTIKSPRGIERVLHTDIYVHMPGSDQSVHIRGIWDTGADGSVITTNVAQALGLQPTGVSRVNTANGMAIQNTYTVDIGLPNMVLVRGVSVTEVDRLSGGMEALIGMDIITLGDFSITNHNGHTCMSFRIPSSHEIDYVNSPIFGSVQIAKDKSQTLYPGTSKNADCPCGSGKKYKRCHGANA